MMKFIKVPSIKYLIDQAASTSLRFPGVMISAVLAAALWIGLIHRDLLDRDFHLLASVYLGIPLFISMTFYRESRGWLSAKAQWLELLLGASLIALHYGLTRGDQTEGYVLRFVQVSLALHLSVAFGAFLKDKDDDRFWELNKTIFLRILMSALYAFVFAAGVSIALTVAGKLFGFAVPTDRYFELWIISVLVVQTLHFLAGMPDLRDLGAVKAYPKGLKVFVQYLLIPLVSLYMIILYVYGAKILLTQVWPSGYVGWLVSVMSVLGVLNLLLIDPEKDQSDSRWIRTYGKAFYLLILPLLLLLFVAVGKRIWAYGMTEQRYALLLLGGILFGLAWLGISY